MCAGRGESCGSTGRPLRRPWPPEHQTRLCANFTTGSQDGADSADLECICRNAASLGRVQTALRLPSQIPGMWGARMHFRRPRPLFCFIFRKQLFTGRVQLRLAITMWLKCARAEDTDDKRLLAAGSYAENRHRRGARRGRAAAVGHPGRPKTARH